MASTASASAASGRPRRIIANDAQRRARKSGAALTPPSDYDLEAVVGRKNLERRAGSGNVLEPACLAPDPHEMLVIGYRLVVVQAQALRSCNLAQLDADDVARMAPILFNRNRIGKGIHGVKDHEVGIAEKRGEALGLGEILELVLGIRGIDHALAPVLEAVSERVAGMRLQLGGHAHAGDIVSLPRLELYEFNCRRQLVEIHGKRRRRMLRSKRALHHV